jgi:lipopolysaccharide cholinephosphotransferase
VALKSHGFFVDVFPVDSMPTSRVKLRVLEIVRDFLLSVANAKQKIYSPSKFKKMVQHVFCLLITSKNIYRLFEKFVHSLQKYQYTSDLVSIISMDTSRNLCKREIFSDLVLKKFEDAEFYIPARYDERLRKIWNNYMELPPENERFGHHGIIKIDFGNYKNL